MPSGGSKRCGRSVWTGCWCSGGAILLRLLRRQVGHYNQQRPHRSLALAVPEAGERQSPQGNPLEVRRRDVVGGLIHEYHEVAA
jgi:hypothetical protein